METNVAPSTAIQSQPAAQLARQLAAVREYLNDLFPERATTIDCILTAAVAGEHVLMVGVPGTGKSMLAREFSRCINGSFYEYLFNKFTTPEEFLGPFSIKGLKADRYDRVLTGRIAEAEVAFLDEIFKSNSASLNTLLPILNERIVFQGGGAQSIPLRIAVAASNELPTDPSLQALWDRIMLRCIVEPLHGEAERRSVMMGISPSRSVPGIDTALIDSIDLRGDVVVPDHVVDTIMVMRRKLEADGIVYGDRRWVKAMECVRAYTLVCGETAATTASLSILASVLWNKESEVASVRTLVEKVASPFVMKAREVFDKVCAEGNVDDFDEMDTTAISDLLPKLQTAHRRIGEQVSKTPSGREREEVRAIAKHLRGIFDRAKASLANRYNLGSE